MAPYSFLYLEAALRQNVGKARPGQGREDVPLSLESWLNSAIRVIKWLLVGRLFPKAREGSPPARPESN